jgi:SNF2 family DNA or RNA helicase
MKPLTSATARVLQPIKLKPEDRLELSLSHDSTKFVAKVFSLRPDNTRTSWDVSYPARNDFPMRIPERKRLATSASTHFGWEFGATDTTVHVITALWPRNQIIFLGEDCVTMYNYLVASSVAYDAVAEIAANYSETKIAPTPTFKTRVDNPLAPYQIAAAHAASKAESYGLFMEQGTGKTAVAVTNICANATHLREVQKATRMYRSLIVTPKNVRANWPDEFDKFGTCPGRTTIIRGTQLDRIKLLIDAFTHPNGHYYSNIVVAYETAVRMLPALKAIEWDMAILDEGHYIKSIKTKRAHAAMEWRDIAGKRMLLTGTPITNTALDMYTQLEFLGKGFSGFQSWEAFKNFYGVFDTDPSSGYSRLIAFQNMPFMKERLARYSFIIRKEEALPNLPSKVWDIIECEMSDEQQQVYDDLRKTLVAEIEAEIEGNNNPQLMVNNALTKLLRLAQITSGYVPLSTEFEKEDGTFGTKKSVYRFDPNPKLEALVTALKELEPNSKAIVWATWVNDITQIRDRLEVEGINAVTYYGNTSDDDREAAKTAFNNDSDCKVFIGNPAAGGTGLNLLGYNPLNESENDINGQAADREFYYSQNWSAVTRSQSEDRAHRRGTRRPVRITDLVMPGTIDEEIRARVLKKRTTAYEISDVRDILRAVLKGVIKDE